MVRRSDYGIQRLTQWLTQWWRRPVRQKYFSHKKVLLLILCTTLYIVEGVAGNRVFAEDWVGLGVL